MTETSRPEALETPVLFIVFNRPETTQKVFDAIRVARPKRLYVAADGPRKNREAEAQRCERVRAIATEVDWPCELQTLFRDENVGCKMGVSTAISWLFEREERGIILEDDCVPAPSFFRFCEELLERYEDDRRIMAISGTNLQDGHRRGDASYYYSWYPHVWGWATWRRAWALYDVALARSWETSKEHRLLEGMFAASKPTLRYWTKGLEAVRSGALDTWDYQWNYTIWANHGLGIVPNVRMVSNIGFGEEATHTHAADRTGEHAQRSDIAFPLVHPQTVTHSFAGDDFLQRRDYSIHAVPARLYLRVRRMLRQGLGRRA